MLHLARKAFYPGTLPFPLLLRRYRLEIPWGCMSSATGPLKPTAVNCWCIKTRKGWRWASTRLSRGSVKHTDIAKTEGLKQALNKYGFDAAFGGARRDEEKSRAKERIYSFRDRFHRWDPKNQRPELWHNYNGQIEQRRKHPRLPALQLDRAGYLAVSLSGKY
ncbi:phosphoadenosine phosphosulfate reductase family protein [Escherichia coli]|nr:phosphoadenosine phosphosulfate reductase family protein [Escherichia coli]